MNHPMNEAFESLDEALDEVDGQRGFIGGPEGQRDLDSDLVVDQADSRKPARSLTTLSRWHSSTGPWTTRTARAGGNDLGTRQCRR